MRVWYRVWQFWQALTAAPGAEVPLGLAPGLQALYAGMPRADRAHGLRTLARLTPEERQHPDLLVAALLHDVGKSRADVHLWDRVLTVLAGRLAPGWLEEVSRREAGPWRGLHRIAVHAEEGARRLAAAGASPLAVALVRWHHAVPAGLGWPEGERRLLEALQRADEGA
ncbi:MAG: hypothetical protein K6V36_07010 [Anaerolineae bacterium]|nr:hypothetical protein [Anaerolineae bacterium]